MRMMMMAAVVALMGGSAHAKEVDCDVAFAAALSAHDTIIAMMGHQLELQRQALRATYGVPQGELSQSRVDLTADIFAGSEERQAAFKRLQTQAYASLDALTLACR